MASITWTIPTIAAGHVGDPPVPLRGAGRAAPIGATFTNHVSAVDDEPPGRGARGSGRARRSTDEVTLTNGAAAPAIDKTANVSGVAGDRPDDHVHHHDDVAGRLDLARRHDHRPSAERHDTPEPGDLVHVRADGLPVVHDPGAVRRHRRQHALRSVRRGSSGPFGAAQTWTWTYTAKMDGTYADATPVPLGTALDNRAEVRFNLIPRLGGAVPNPAHLNQYDGLVGDTAPVVFNRPVVAIDKARPDARPVAARRRRASRTRVTLDNSGGVNATNVTFTDPGAAQRRPDASARIDPASVSGATYNAGTGTFTVATVPAGGNPTVTYRVTGRREHRSPSPTTTTNTATLTGYRDPASNVYTVTLPDYRDRHRRPAEPHARQAAAVGVADRGYERRDDLRTASR